jgi:hypothetical protein
MFRFLRRRTTGGNAMVESAKLLCIHRGAVVGQWANIESSVDQANHYGWRFSREIVGNVVPQSLRWKKQTFEKLHVKSLPFLPLREQATRILAAIEAHEEDRHFLVHGYWDGEDDGGWLLKKHVFERDGSVSVVKCRYTHDELLDLQVELTKLVNQMTAYLNALIAQIEKHPLHN